MIRHPIGHAYIFIYAMNKHISSHSRRQRSNAMVTMRESTTLLIGLTALICSTQGYSIDRAKRDDNGTLKTTEVTASTVVIPSSPKEKRSIPIPNRRRGLITTGSTEEDGVTSQGESTSDIVLEKVKTLLDYAVDETNQQMKKSSNTRNSDVSEKTAKWLKRLKYILVAEIDNLIKAIGDGRYADPGQRPDRSLKPEQSLLKSSFSSIGIPQLTILPPYLFNLDFLNGLNDVFWDMIYPFRSPRAKV